MRKFLILLCIIFFSVPAFARDEAVDPSVIYDEILRASNYELVDYNYPAGSRELNLFGLRSSRQMNLNAVVAPDKNYLIYSEVYFYPDPRVTASALYLIPLDSGMSEREAILSVSTKDRLQTPIIETNYAKLYPFKFDTFTPVDWSQKSDKILFKEKIGQNYDQIYMTKLFIFDLSTEKLYDLNIIRTKIMEHWQRKGIFLSDYKWDIHPLGFMNKSNNVVVNAYGYYKNERRFLGVWSVDSIGSAVHMLSLDETFKPDISANGKCLKFIPDMGDIIKKQRRIDAKTKKPIIEPK